MAAAPLPLRSPLPLQPEPRPVSAPSPHWASGARGCPGHLRGALTEGGGSRAEGRDAAAAGGRRARVRSKEEADGGERKWGWGSGKKRWEERGRVGGAGAGGGRVKNRDVRKQGRLGEVWGWAGLRPSLFRLKHEGARPRDSEVISSHPTLEVIATRSEAEVSPLLLCPLGILDLGTDRNCSSLNYFRLILSSVL